MLNCSLWSFEQLRTENKMRHVIREPESRTTHDHVTSSSQSQRSIDSGRGINWITVQVVTNVGLYKFRDYE